METSDVKKPIKKTSGGSIRVKAETKKRILAELLKINKKPHGRSIRADQYLVLAMSLIKPEHIQKLQDESLSNADRIEIKYREYIKSHGLISKDEFLGTLFSVKSAAEISQK